MFQSGGAIQPGSIYIKRQADQELYDKLRKSEFCYVLAPRQIGKSSLKVQVANRFIDEGIACALIDLLLIGEKSSTSDQWYYDLVKALADEVTGLNLQCNVREFWESHQDDSVVRRWVLFLRDVVLKQIPGNIVIFIDEIDSILSLKNRDASDDFFASIKGIYDLRAQLPDFQRLTFCLIGVAAPNDLIQDATRTPFNIGKPIRLNDFTEEETLQFKDGFQDIEGDSEILVREIFDWTNGHPYMTQRICEELTFQVFDEPVSEAEKVERIVHKCFLNLGRNGDTNLEYAEKRFNEKSSTAQKAQILEVYRHLLNNDLVPLEENNSSHLELRLTGLASTRVKNGKEHLQIRNKIFATIFNIDWVREKEGNRFLADSLARWIESGKSDDYLLRGQALVEALIASRTKDDLTKNERDFLFASQQFETDEKIQQQRAEAQQLIAEAEQKRAEEAERRAEAERLRAEEIQQHAKALELQTRQFIYDFDIINAQQIMGVDSKRALELLEKQIPKLGPNSEAVPDLRHFEWYYLREQCPTEIITLTGHSYHIFSVAFSPDGKWLATGSGDKTVRVWDTETWQPVTTLTGHSNDIFSVAFSPNGKWLCTGSWDRTVKVWDVGMWQEVAILIGHTDGVFSVAFSPDGNQLATGSRDKTVRVWEVGTWQAVTTLTGHIDAVLSVVFSPDGKQLATGSGDKTVRVWGVNTWQAVALLAGHSDHIYTLAFSPDGKRLITGSTDKTVKVWNAETWQTTTTLAEHADSVLSVAFSLDGKRLATGSWDNTVKVWDVSKWQVVMTLIGHSGSVDSVAFSPDGRRLVTGGEDTTVKVWDVDTLQTTTTLSVQTNPVYSVAFSPDGKWLAMGSLDKTVKVWDVDRWQELVTLTLHSDFVFSVGFSPDGKWLVTGSEDQTANVWDVETWQVVATLTGHSNSVYSLALSPDGKWLATGSSDATVEIWDMHSWQAVVTLTGNASSIYSLAFSPDGKWLVSGSRDTTVKVWDTHIWQTVAILTRHTDPVNSVNFSPDGKWLATGSSDYTAKVWETETWQPVVTLAGHTGSVFSATFSPNGKRLATGSSDCTVKVWDVNTWQAITTLTGHSDNIRSVTFSPNGKRLATGSDDSSVKVWLTQQTEEEKLQLTQFLWKQEIFKMAKTGNLLWVQYLINSQPLLVSSTDKNGAPPLMWAIYGGHLEIVKLLINKGADPNQKGLIYLDDPKDAYYGSPLVTAAGEGHLSVLQYLLETLNLNLEDSEIDKDGKETKWTALMWAASKGQLSIIEYLVSKGAQINCIEQINGETPLHQAAKSGHMEVVQFLFKQGADLNAKNKYGQTPYFSAFEAGETTVTDFLRNYKSKNKEQ